MTQKKLLLLGAHMSIAGGFETAIKQGESIGCTAIQIFTKSNRQWYAKGITDDQAQLFKHMLSNSPIQIVVAHASYLINLGSPDHAIAEKSTKALAQELHRCDQLGIPYLILHPGSYRESNKNICLQQITQNIDIALNIAQPKATILLETMAGQGTSVGDRFEDIATVIALSSNPDSIGVCFDTCHAFAAGYDFRDQSSYTSMWKQFDTIIGLNKLKAIHLNDSKKGLGSHVDRHEAIGAGKLGLSPFKLIMNDKNLTAIPKILETPKASLDDDRKNIEILKSLIDN